MQAVLQVQVHQVLQAWQEDDHQVLRIKGNKVLQDSGGTDEKTQDNMIEIVYSVNCKYLNQRILMSYFKTNF